MTAQGDQDTPCRVYSLVYGTDKQMTYTSAEVEDDEYQAEFRNCVFISQEHILVAISRRLVIMDLKLRKKKVFLPNQIDPCVVKIWMMSNAYN